MPNKNTTEGGIAGLETWESGAKSTRGVPTHICVRRDEAIAIDEQRIATEQQHLATIKERDGQIDLLRYDKRELGLKVDRLCSRGIEDMKFTIKEQAGEIERLQSDRTKAGALIDRLRDDYESVSDDLARSSKYLNEETGKLRRLELKLPTYSPDDIDKPGEVFVPGVDECWVVGTAPMRSTVPAVLMASSELQPINGTWEGGRGVGHWIKDFYSTEKAALAAMQGAGE